MKEPEVQSIVCNAKTMIEIGGHDGTDTARFVEMNPSLELFCFEPDPRSFEKLSALKLPKNVRIYNYAISDKVGMAEFYLSSGNTPGFKDRLHTDSSSLKRPTRHLVQHPWVKFKDKIVVQTRTLDYMFPVEKSFVFDLIWCDVQGALREVILGGPGVLARTRYLYAECPKVALYDGEIVQSEIQDWLPGWEVEKWYANDVLLRNTRS